MAKINHLDMGAEDIGTGRCTGKEGFHGFDHQVDLQTNQQCD